MASEILLDNDIIIKSSQFSITDELVKSLNNYGSPHILSVSAFVILKQVTAKKKLSNPGQISKNCTTLLGHLNRIEPTEKEISLAADLEDQARTMLLELDVGESQLLAILMNRGSRLMVTGDKRAIIGIEQFIKGKFEFKHKIACFEQLLLEIIGMHDFDTLRAKICTEAVADKAISICFSCLSGESQKDSALSGLSSYINSVRNTSPESLIISNDLSALSS
ncbi:hypothetical protein [Asticcacaulis taihuensis]|uniref:PIN domain-containing protein n=1 Tax=Asticcacaulis taihuensis TaxID=260084 RepID=A0A1G4SVM5_9CAUL|nr:hypothetical protein [Asticcacaulis taihuensis]SCW73242.1 hypothetical protein SAMN02927928_3036 [Asticcacaulis taihuensis]